MDKKSIIQWNCRGLKANYNEVLILMSVWEIAVHLAVACDVDDGVFLCCPFSHEVSWMRS